LLRFLADSVIAIVPGIIFTDNATATTASLQERLPLQEQKVLAIIIDAFTASLANILIG